MSHFIDKKTEAQRRQEVYFEFPGVNLTRSPEWSPGIYISDLHTSSVHVGNEGESLLTSESTTWENEWRLNSYPWRNNAGQALFTLSVCYASKVCLLEIHIST